MAPRGSEIAMVIVLATALWAGVSAQSGCTSVIISLSPCLGYITGNSSTPSSSCCTQLASVVSKQARCLCTVLNGGASSYGLNLNQTQALALPGACNVQTPPVSQCNAVSPSGSTASPTTPSTPSGPSDTTPSTATPTIPSGKGARTVPATDGVASVASATAIMPLPLLLSVFFIATYASSPAVF